jgi:phosphatidylglycerophosphatase A
MSTLNEGTAGRTAPARAAASPMLGLATLLATGLGSGYSPLAPGTAGTVVGLLLFWPMHGVPLVYQVAATLVLFLFGVQAATIVERETGLKDPGIVVVDEIIGVWITLLMVPWTLAYVVAGFLLFRVFDVVKPFPARRAESLPHGWGIVCDDVMAGIYANLVLQAAHWFLARG